MDVTLSPSSLRRGLFKAVAVVATLGLLSEVAYYETDLESGEYLMEVFSLSMEHNFPTWFSAALHVLCAGLLALAAVAAAQGGKRYVRHWAFLSGAFAYISLDETVTIHEKLNRLVDLGEYEALGGGLFHYGWIVPAAGVVLVLGLSYAGFLLHLPPRTRRDVLLAGGVFVGGAVLMEMPLGVWSAAHGVDNLGYVLIDAVEETLEMLGMSLFIAALVRYLASPEQGLRLLLCAKDAAAGARQDDALLPTAQLLAGSATEADPPEPVAAPLATPAATPIAAAAAAPARKPVAAPAAVAGELNAWVAPTPPPELAPARPTVLERSAPVTAPPRPAAPAPLPARSSDLPAQPTAPAAVTMPPAPAAASSPGTDASAPTLSESLAARVVAASLGGFPRPRATPPGGG